MAVKKMFLPVTIFVLLVLSGIAVYSVPLSEKTKVITWTVTTEFVEPKTFGTGEVLIKAGLAVKR